MFEKSDTNIADSLASFSSVNLEVAMIVPTQTGMSKSIMDATATVREYLLDTGFHDYEKQGQGQDCKVVRRAYFVFPDCIQETKVSLYRPVTKNGDPRIWFSKLARYAEPYNLLALLVFRDDLYIVNCSNPVNLLALQQGYSPLQPIIDAVRPTEDSAVAELLAMIADISKMGFVRSMRTGDTGVGMTLESLLGIAANTNKAPDYKGIEIKAKRKRCKSRQTRVTLFSQAPNWPLSPINSAWSLLSTYGYRRALGEKLRLNHEMNALQPNSIGFVLELDAANDWLRQNHVDKEKNLTRHLITWEMDLLRKRLMEKHPQTFWVEALCQGPRNAEEFHYVKVIHTKQPRIRNFDTLLESGLISVDYLMSSKNEERRTVRDHGYLFKMHPRNFDALFPPPKIHIFQ